MPTTTPNASTSDPSLYLHGIGHFHPENVIDNPFLENLDIGTSEEWILERVGIRTRRTVLPLDYIKSTRNADPRAAFEAAQYTSVETGRRACLHAIARAGIAPSDIGMVISGGCCPEMSIPSEACRIAAALDFGGPCPGHQLGVLQLRRPTSLSRVDVARSPPALRACRESRRTRRALSATQTARARFFGVTEPVRRLSQAKFPREPASWKPP